MTDEVQADTVEPTPPAVDPQGKTYGEDFVQGLYAENAKWRTKLRDLEGKFEELTKQQEQAKQKDMAEQGKYKELFDEATKQVADLEPLKGKVERYEGALVKLLEAQRQTVPEGIRALLDKLDPVDQLEWLAENARQPEPDKPAKLQPFSPAGGEPQKLSDKQILDGLYRDMGQGSGLFG